MRTLWVGSFTFFLFDGNAGPAWTMMTRGLWQSFCITVHYLILVRPGLVLSLLLIMRKLLR
jgi:hypothetical protein